MQDVEVLHDQAMRNTCNVSLQMVYPLPHTSIKYTYVRRIDFNQNNSYPLALS